MWIHMCVFIFGSQNPMSGIFLDHCPLLRQDLFLNPVLTGWLQWLLHSLPWESLLVSHVPGCTGGLLHLPEDVVIQRYFRIIS